MLDLRVRRAEPDDWPTIVDFNCRLAVETESQQLDPETVRVGVQALLSDTAKGRYFVACVGAGIVGQIMHTREWSDWRNGDIWWLQSVYVTPEFRSRGVFRALFEHLLDECHADPNVVGLRLYVENHNHPAQQVYQRMGLAPAGYSVLQKLFK